MRRFFRYAPMLLLLFSIGASAQTPCPTGEKRLRPAEECIPVALFNYLYCLERSGGGRVEVVKRDETNKNKTYRIDLAGEGKGIIVAGSAKGGISASDSQKVINELKEVLDKSLVARCATFARPASKKPLTSKPASPASAPLRFVAQFDRETREEFLRISTVVDSHLVRAKNSPNNQSAFTPSEWETVLIDLRALLRRNEAREKNYETIEMIRILISQWTRDKDMLTQPAPSAILDSLGNILGQSFTLAISAENIKVRN